MSQLSSPEQQKAEVVLLTSVSKAKEWVRNLPLTNMGEVTRVLYQSLAALNQHPLLPVIRTDITEVLLPYVNLALENLGRHFSTRSFPLPERSQRVFDLKQALQQELAGSYQLAALDMLTRGTVNHKRLTLSIGRAISYMGRTLMNTYSIYVRSKRNVWHDLHHLYLLACENKIQNRVIPQEPGDKQHGSFTIEGLYKLFNLVAMGVPNSLRQGEVERLERFFVTMVNQVSILDDVDSISGDYAHISLLNSDEPATLMPVSEVLNSPTSRIFDVSKVEETLRHFIEITPDIGFGLHQDQPMLSRSLAKRLLTTLTTASCRKNKRFERDDVASVVFRLGGVVSVVASSDSNEGGCEESADAEDSLYERLALGGGAESPWVEVEVETPVEDNDAEIQPWYIDNSSARGYGLRQKIVGPSSARVGEILGIRDPSDASKNWQVAVIRWMDFYRGKGLCFGAEVLSPRAESVLVSGVSNRKATQRFPVSGLKLPQVDGVREKPALVLPAYMFIPEDILIVGSSHSETQLQITAIDECLGSFAYCDFIELTKEEEEVSENDFSDVWDFI
ncbi:MAG: hypothetical protein CSB47_09600 [Proteobacteria bacterium]|nr:MAG: hypothetical protein CSB47_09600 [Pseudomonadota bacterium]